MTGKAGETGETGDPGVPAALGLASKAVRLVTYDHRWPLLFAEEAERIAAAVAAAGLPPLRLEHVGSTAVPGLAAKPILDLAAGRRPDVSGSAYVPALEAAGYRYRGEQGIPGRDFFRRGTDRTHHLHLVEKDGTEWRRYLAFRDALRSDPTLLERYASLKRELAERFPRDRESYIEGKSEFIDSVVGISRRG